MGDTGSEHSPETRGISMVPGIGEAECEAIASDATLRDLIRLWSALDVSVRQAIAVIARRSGPKS